MPSTLGIVASAKYVAPPSLDAYTWAYRFESDNIALADAAPIDSWPDTSGNNRHATGSGATRPIFKTNILNGHPVVRYPDTAGRLATAAITALAQPNTIFAVCIQAQAGDAAVYDGIDGANRHFFSGYGGGADYALNAGAWALFGNRTGIGWRIFAITWNGAASRFRASGGAGTLMNPGSNALTGLTIGNINTSGSQAIRGDIAAILVSPDDLPVADINVIGGILASRYALTWTPAT